MVVFQSVFTQTLTTLEWEEGLRYPLKRLLLDSPVLDLTLRACCPKKVPQVAARVSRNEPTNQVLTIS